MVRILVRPSSGFLALALCLSWLAACEPTPGYLERWANREGSEEMYEKYLHDPDVSHEVHVRALELLIDQWQYSSGLFTGGRIVAEMPDPAERDATIMDTLPHVRSLYAERETESVALEALAALRQGTDSAEVRAAIDETFVDFVQNKWEPCVERATRLSTAQLFTILGRERVEPRLIRTVEEGSIDDVLCQVQRISGVEWVPEATNYAQALMARWDAGNLSDVEQLNFDYFEHLVSMRQLPEVRAWMWDKVGDAETSALYRNAMLDALAREPTDDDIPRYVGLLDSETYTRWAAFEALVNRNGSAGLEQAISGLPAASEYGYYDGQVRPDGYKSVLENIVCGITKLTELGDNARQVFERHVTDPNPYARALSITCLQRYGTAQTVERLRAVREELGRDPVPVPSFGEDASFQGLIDETIAAIEERSAQP